MEIIVAHRFECYDDAAIRAVARAFYRGGAMRAWLLIGIAARHPKSVTTKLSMGFCSVQPLLHPRFVERVEERVSKYVWFEGIRYPVFSVLVPDFPRELEGATEPRAVEESVSDPGPG